MSCFKHTEGLRGEIFLPTDVGYKEAIKVWSISPHGQGKPSVVVQPRGTLDIVLAVKHARKLGLKVTVKGGGHSAGNAPLRDGALMIDMSKMNGVIVDAQAKTAWVEGGALLGDVDAETSLYGLATTMGLAPVTGMGLAVNGGSGNLIKQKEAFIKPLRDLGPVQDTVGLWTYHQTQNTLMPGIMGREAARATGINIWEYWSGGYFTRETFSDECLETLVRTVNTETPECPFTLALIQTIGGKVKESKAPIGFKFADIEWVAQVGWADPSLNATGMNYARQMKEAMKRFKGAEEAYVNFTDCSEHAPIPNDPAIRVGGKENLDRITSIKMRVDPENVFCATPFQKLLKLTSVGATGAE